MSIPDPSSERIPDELGPARGIFWASVLSLIALLVIVLLVLIIGWYWACVVVGVAVLLTARILFTIFENVERKP